MAQETMAESDRLRRLVANASSEAEKKAAQEDAGKGRQVAGVAGRRCVKIKMECH